jgi:alpha-amylase
MPSVTLYFKIHQPYRLHNYSLDDITVKHAYADEEATANVISQMADECYLPANEILLSLLRENNGKFKVAFSISGATLEILEKYRPDVVKSFRQLVRTENVEILAETYYNSLSWLHNKKEFEEQVNKHDRIVKKLLGIAPTVFRNTELIYNNDLAKHIAGMGYKGILCEGLDKILKGRSSNHLYAAPDNGDFGILLRHVNLSDDIAFRFDDSNWNEFPLTAEKFAQWIHSHVEEKNNINLFLDYETFGVHKKSGSGIFDFLKALPGHVLSNTDFTFTTPSEVLQKNYPTSIYDVPQTISWEDKSVENCVWCECMEQNNMLKKIYSLSNAVHAAMNDEITETWQRLQCADYFYYMGAGNTHCSANPYSSTEAAYKNYNNIITDFEIGLINYNLEKFKNKSLSNKLY